MPLAEDIITARYSIQAYDHGQITINEKIYTESLLLSPEQLVTPWPVSSVEALEVVHLAAIFNLKPDVVLLGTGEHQVFPEVSILGAFAQQGLGLEVMNNGAMCRTFNILVAEGRQVVAAAIQGQATANPVARERS